MEFNSTQYDPDTFHIFIQDWMTRSEHYLQQLLHHLQFPNQQDEDSERTELELKFLIGQVLTHYHEYFLAKGQLSRQNVFLVLSPPWFTPYERTFHWLAGFRPGLVIYVVKRCGIEFSSDQAERLEMLAVETMNGEREMTERLARLEAELVAPRVVAIARLGGREVNGMANEVDRVVDRLGKSLEVLVGCADYLRKKTVVRVVGILTTGQTVRFLAAAVQFQLRIRRWGQQFEAQASASGGDQ